MDGPLRARSGGERIPIGCGCGRVSGLFARAVLSSGQPSAGPVSGPLRMTSIFDAINRLPHAEEGSGEAGARLEARTLSMRQDFARPLRFVRLRLLRPEPIGRNAHKKSKPARVDTALAKSRMIGSAATRRENEIFVVH